MTLCVAYWSVRRRNSDWLSSHSWTLKMSPQMRMRMPPHTWRSRMAMRPIVMRLVVLSKMRWRTWQSRTSRGLLLLQRDAGESFYNREINDTMPKKGLCRLCVVSISVTLARVPRTGSQFKPSLHHLLRMAINSA